MRPDPDLRPDSLMQKIRSARQSDASFRRAHRTVQIIMASWAVIVVLDRLIGLVSHSYTGSSLPFALAGGAVLVGIALLGARGHIQGALMVMQINMAVFLVQFAATCFLYREHTALWSTLFYGVSAGVLDRRLPDALSPPGSGRLPRRSAPLQGEAGPRSPFLPHQQPAHPHQKIRLPI